jgi:hypothetical protein
MSNMVTLWTLLNDLFRALSSFVTYLVAFEAHLGVTIKRLVGVLPAKNATPTLCFIWTLSRHMPELFAVSTLYCGVSF